MKIAMVSMNAGPLAALGGVDGGGQSVLVDCLSRALSMVGHRVTIYTHRDDPSLPRDLTTAAGVRVEYVDADWPPASEPPVLSEAIETFRERLSREWRQDPPDVVHAHSWMSGKAAVAAARPLDIPVIQTFGGLGEAKRRRGDGADPGALRVDQEAALIGAVARIVATSSAQVFALLAMGANPRAIKLVPCGVDLELFRPVARPARAADSVFRVATLSRLVPDAGVGDVVEALRFIDGVELIVGGGRYAGRDILVDPEAQALETLAHDRGVAGRVSFHGRVKRDEVATFLRSADVVICAPWHESIATVALEAMACGVPVIVSAVGGHLDAVADGMTGIHVPSRAPRQLAYAIATLKADPALRERFGRFGVERTSARYGWPRIAAETFEVYRSVASGSALLNQSRSRA